ncbi:L-histidine N(alpha)-methyltransferase [Nostocoides sp. Soil756]|uniref:L-histidine N(alpha)-methyltransferase n=1 Tax=Nostocoides sp. Soil756 TaxID=1736399 RepID=UPI0006F3735B|nr:L-histidine N(alpha)-methyltransferase [Tetrasphaera sp. Soil756]KRE63528.1 dimethylhistidine N-methyltransferase [Tetrasphaera sp. Soil756]
MSGVVEPRVEVLLDPDRAGASLVDDVRRGLGGRPRRLPPKWLYDDEGSRLFDEITRLPEYYPTEAERAILAEHAADIAAACDASTLVELGSGTSDKTRTLLDAFRDPARPGGVLRRFVPVDVSDATLREAAVSLSRRYPGLAVEAVVGDFTLHLGQLPRGDRRLVAFLGSTIGNFYLEERAAFLGALADSLEPGEWLLLGTDLVKSADRLVAAYDDEGRLTERFIRNCLTVLNRELGADFDPGAFSYAPLWDARMQRVDMRLRAEEAQHVSVPGAGLELDLAAGEELHVEISTKFTRDGIRAELADAGFEVTDTWSDLAGDFALTLARRL